MSELEKLLNGNKKFVEGKLSSKDFKAQREAVVDGQKPFVTIITCSDSRVVPEYIFDARIGEIFTIINAGNITDKSVLGSIEYGVGHLHTPLLMILGHSKCGAVTAACGGHREGNNIDYIMDKINPAVNKEDIEGSIDENLRCVKKDILEKSSTTKKLVDEGKLKVVCAKYYLENGEVKIIEG